MAIPRQSPAGAAPALTPLAKTGQPVEWWFAFKFNDHTYPGDASKEPNPGIFGGIPGRYKDGFCLSYACASSANPTLQMAAGSIGDSLTDPLGATFNQIYHGACNYVLWNDQFENHPIPNGDPHSGHSKGVLAWDNTGAGLVIQVTSPSWPASGSALHPRVGDGNTLGCIKDEAISDSVNTPPDSATPAPSASCPIPPA
jgi:hypothetical protein